MGGTICPAALMHARVVICSLLPELMEYTDFAPLGARTLPIVFKGGVNQISETS